uniref:Uncharacterized protein n=1 Tax=Ciona intestinalis TaxID=7719 RepID=H2XZN9_CIOIN
MSSNKPFMSSGVSIFSATIGLDVVSASTANASCKSIKTNWSICTYHSP